MSAAVPIKIVAFDLGKVLVDFDYRRSAIELAKQAAATPEQVYRCLITDDLLVRYEVGAMTFEAFFAEFRRATGYRGDREYFEHWLGRIFTPITPMVDLHAEVRSRRLPTWIFSNTNDIAVRCITADFPFFRQFTGYVYSFEVRSMKPAPEMYQNLEDRTGCRGPEILYLDDRPENIATARARGWQALVHEDPVLTIPQVRRRLNHGG